RHLQSRTRISILSSGSTAKIGTRRRALTRCLWSITPLKGWNRADQAPRGALFKHAIVELDSKRSISAARMFPRNMRWHSRKGHALKTATLMPDRKARRRCGPPPYRLPGRHRIRSSAGPRLMTLKVMDGEPLVHHHEEPVTAKIRQQGSRPAAGPIPPGSVVM